ncbi:hypothetical protein [Candidatus Accumulibacter sp. ACC003]|uniref:hypothetical protein n=1 Tax=Candidatus Accumulibacter sp. ACC003 TaxID=2823334 RepID=UPI0025C657FF|nr:hypothetical protein [Candidatus Accumulibacter sp. ACC003]
MRIPAEVVPLVSNVGKPETDEVRKTEPVTSSNRVGDELSAAAHDQSLPVTERQPRPQHETATPDVPEPAGQTVAIERRQVERRSEKLPVLLDTRSQRGRRKAGDDVKINIKV